MQIRTCQVITLPALMENPTHSLFVQTARPLYAPSPAPLCLLITLTYCKWILRTPSHVFIPINENETRRITLHASIKHPRLVQVRVLPNRFVMEIHPVTITMLRSTKNVRFSPTISIMESRKLENEATEWTGRTGSWNRVSPRIMTQKRRMKTIWKAYWITLFASQTRNAKGTDILLHQPVTA